MAKKLPSMHTLGMYRLHEEKGYPCIVVGEYTICEQDAERMWIEHVSGEGMACGKKALEICITKFYKDNF
jgi:hypothetical protein